MSTPSSSSGFVLGSKLYDKVKFFVQIVLPATATLYTVLAALWGWPDTKEVVGSLTGIALFLGTVVHISSANFTAPPTEGTPIGNFTVTEHPDGTKTINLGELNQDPANIADGEVISFHKASALPEAPLDAEGRD